MDSTGLHAVIQARERARANGHRFVLVGAKEPVQRLFELTSTEYLLEVDP